MFDKVNMTITCTTETRERPVVQQAGLARRRAAAGSIGGEQRQDVLSSVAAAMPHAEPTVNRGATVLSTHNVKRHPPHCRSPRRHQRRDA